MKVLRRTLIAFLALGTLSVAAAFVALYLIGSERGSAWLLDRAVARSSGRLAIAGSEGSLLDGLTLHGVRLRLPQDEVDIERITLVWDMSAALAGVVVLETVDATTIAYRRLPGAAPAARAPLELPFDLRVAAAAFERLTLEVNGTAVEVGPSRLAAAFADGRLTLERVESQAQGVELRGEAAVALGATLGLETRVAWRRAGEPELAGLLEARGDWPVLRVDLALSAPFAASARGSVRLDGTPSGELTLEWRDAAWPGVAGASPTGRATLAGTLEELRFAIAAGVAAEGRELAVEANGTATRERVQIDALMAALGSAGAAGIVRASGAVGVTARDWQLDVALERFDPGWLAAAWPGRVDGSARVTGRLTPALEWQVADLRASGELRDVALEAGGGIAYASGELALDALRVAAGANVVTVGGRAATAADGALALAIEADLARLGELVPDADGAIALTAAVSGTRAAPHAQGSATARALRYAGLEVDEIEVRGAGGLGAADELDVELTAAGLRRGAVEVDTVRASAAGTAAAHTFEIGARRRDLEAAFEGHGGLEAGRWSGVLENVRLDEALGDWRLVEPAALELAPSSAALGTACLLHESGARGCVELTLEGNPADRVIVSVQNIDLGSLSPLLPPQLSLEGTYQISASFTDPTGDPRGALALTGGTTTVRLDMGEQEPFVTELYGLIVSATLADRRLTVLGTVEDGADGSAALEAAIDDVTARDSPVSGKVSVHWPDMALLSLLSPDIGEVGGVLRVDLTAAGTVAAPEVEGRAELTDGRVDVPAWGVTIVDIDLLAESADGRSLDFNATGMVGEGTVRVTGRTELDPEAGWPTRLTLQGTEVRAVQLADVEVFMSPDLTARIELPDVLVTGTVHVPRASIELSALPAQAISPSRDAIVHDRGENGAVRPLNLRADIDLTLGEDVDYSGLNLTTDVTGALNLRVERGTATATGELTLSGTYNAYGQALELERGELIFNGPLNDPGLDVRAVRTIDEKRVGVELAGTIKDPRTRIISSPVMSEADALSYLLLGRPLHGTAGEESATLQSAALTMGLQQALPVVQRIGASIGLDELTVQTTTQDAGELQAGKYLSPRLYIRYSYGLFNRIGGLLLRFKVNDRLSIETQSGDQQSMDLLYTVEKD